MEYFYAFYSPTLAWIFGIFYFIPCVIAFVRGHSSRYGILVLNFFLGWTFIFWVVSLAWALSKKD
ncbi:superinfection immunity protein [Helicobacter pametensis]|uniref:superinfection immunity protein n=1 Tax=Helicobacter pametensis TaxID=95149 RepID=UPI0004BC8CD4|nr:superinfection immunity protein [Helicobacter pametensis]